MDNVIVLSQSLKCFPVVAMCHTEITLVGGGHSYDPQEVPNGLQKHHLDIDLSSSNRTSRQTKAPH